MLAMSARIAADSAPDELAYQQAVRDIDRMIHWETGRGVTRKQRNNFERFLQHPNERIRHYAEGIAARDRGGVDERMGDVFVPVSLNDQTE